MKVLKIMVSDGRIYHQRLSAFPDAAQVELVDMTPDEYQAIPANNDTFERLQGALLDA